MSAQRTRDRAFDVIGDIHGHAAALESLLSRMGYSESGGVYGHPDRTALFVGDFVDRGPRIRDVLAIVRKMIDGGSALAVMGNHEYNAICFNVRKDDEPHRWLRSRTDRHIQQHLETIYQFRHHKREWLDYLVWFRTLPLFLDVGPIRVVHASWYEPSLEILRRHLGGKNSLTETFLRKATRVRTEEFKAIQNVLKGVELELPGSALFVDKDGVERQEMRVRWWLNGKGLTYREIAIHPLSNIEETTLDKKDAERLAGYEDPIPVFFGHYWLDAEVPSVINPRIACLDYSIAMGGYLVAYRWDGETELTDDHFVVQ